MAFSIGDIVKLKSGGMPMTVLGPYPTGNVHCAWMDKNGVPHELALPPDALVLAKDAADPDTGCEITIDGVVARIEDYDFLEIKSIGSVNPEGRGSLEIKDFMVDASEGLALPAYMAWAQQVTSPLPLREGDAMMEFFKGK